MVSSDVMRGFNDLIILTILNDGDSYGYEIGEQIKTLTEGLYVMKETTLYSAFNRLEKNEYITSYKGSETMGRARVYFKITVEGKRYLKLKQTEWKYVKKIMNTFTEKGED